MKYPLSLRFKLLALAPQIYVEDADGQTACYVKQKLFRLKEKVEVYHDATRRSLLSTIAADRIIDWSARYSFADPSGQVFGSVGRRGMRSLWSAHYDVFLGSNSQPAFEIREINPIAKIVDSFIGGIPLIGVLSCYFFHPTYQASRPDGTAVMRLTKRPSFFERRFSIEHESDLSDTEELTLLLSYMMLTLLESRRG